MKTERRHELQTNVLADWIGHKTEAIRPYLKLIVGGLAAIFIVAVLATVISNQQLERSSRGWADYFAASSGDSPDRLRTVAEEHAGTLPAIWATQREADLELARGIRALYSSRGESTEALGAAKKLYQSVEAGAAGQAVLKQAAQFGLAQAFEAEGDVEKAIDYYEKAVGSGKESSVGKQAQERLERLKDKDVQEFLAWFARQTPQPRAPQGGFPGGPDDGLDVPRDLSEIPGRPDLSIPMPPDNANPRADSTFPTEDPASTTPAPEGSAPPAPEPEVKQPEATEPAATTPDGKAPESKTPESKTPEAKTPGDSPAAAPEDSPAAAPEESPAAAPEDSPAAAPAEPPAKAPAGDGAANE